MPVTRSVTAFSAVLVCDCDCRVQAPTAERAWVLMARHEQAAHPGRQEAQRHVRGRAREQLHG